MEKHPFATYRKFIGLSQGDLAVLVGYSTCMVSHWEKGTKPISPRALSKIASLFCKTSEQVVNDIDSWRKKRLVGLRSKVSLGVKVKENV